MKLLIEIDEDYYNKILTIKPSHYTARVYLAVQNGQPLPENTMILDKDKLERDTEWDDYYDGFMSYSQIALEAAEIKEQTE